MRTTLRKGEILRGFGVFSEVIAQGESRAVAPLRMFFRITPKGSVGLRVGFATSRQIRKAASRNRLKRLMREAFRILREGSGLVESAKSSKIDLVVMYVGNPRRRAATVRLAEIQASMARLLAEPARKSAERTG